MPEAIDIKAHVPDEQPRYCYRGDVVLKGEWKGVDLENVDGQDTLGRYLSAGADRKE
jgi:hypothetical protein